MDLSELDFLIYVGRFAEDCKFKRVDGKVYDSDCFDIWYIKIAHSKKGSAYFYNYPVTFSIEQ